MFCRCHVQVSAGCASFILGIANAVTCAWYGVLGFGLWCGVLVSNPFFLFFYLTNVFSGVTQGYAEGNWLLKPNKNVGCRHRKR